MRLGIFYNRKTIFILQVVLALFWISFSSCQKENSGCQTDNDVLSCSYNCSDSDNPCLEAIECHANNCAINCESHSSCVGLTINCTAADTCVVTCSESNSCTSINIIDPTAVICSGSSSCINASITSNKETLNIDCSYDDACETASITAKNLILTCSSNRSCIGATVVAYDTRYNCSGEESCYKLSSTSSSVSLNCSETRACAFSNFSTSGNMCFNCNGEDACNSFDAYAHSNLTGHCYGLRACQQSNISSSYSLTMECGNGTSSCANAQMSALKTMDVDCLFDDSCNGLELTCGTDRHGASGNTNDCLTTCHHYCPDNTLASSSSVSRPLKPTPSPSASPVIRVINGTLNITSTTLVVNQTVLIEGSLDGENTTIIFPIDAGAVVKVEGNITIRGQIILQLGWNGLVNSTQIPVFEFAADNIVDLNVTFQIVQNDGSPLGECKDVDVVQTRTSTSLAVTLMPKEQKQGCGNEESSTDGDDTGNIVGIVVGCVVGALIVTVIVAVVIIWFAKVKFKSTSF